MGDNILVPKALEGSLAATDEVTINGVAVQVQRIKVGYGPEDAYNEITLVLPMPTIPSDKIIAGTAADNPNFVVLSHTATATELVAAVTGRIRVVSLFATIDVTTGDETYQFASGTAPTAITGLLGDADGAAGVVPIALGYNPAGWFQTGVAEKLQLVIAGTAPKINGGFSWVEVAS